MRVPPHRFEKRITQALTVISLVLQFSAFSLAADTCRAQETPPACDAYVVGTHSETSNAALFPAKYGRPSAAGSASADPPQADTNGPDNEWHFAVAPYLWFPGAHGTATGPNDRGLSFRASPGDLLSLFRFGLMGGVEEATQGMAISWPGHIDDPGGIRHQFHHIIDIVPTILEATQIRQPDYVDGIKQKPIEGVSMMYTFKKANANAPSTHHTQYFEMFGDHALYHDGWIASTKVMRPPWVTGAIIKENPADYPWEFYDVSKDWTQFDSVADKYSAKLKELQDVFRQEAEKYEGLGMETLAFGSPVGVGRVGTGVLKVDGKAVARRTWNTPFPSFCNGTKTSTLAPTRELLSTKSINRPSTSTAQSTS